MMKFFGGNKVRLLAVNYFQKKLHQIFGRVINMYYAQERKRTRSLVFATLPAITRSMLTIETLEEGLEYVQS